MSPLPLPTRRRDSASALIVVMFTIAILAVFIGLALDYTIGTAHESARARDLTNEESLANGALEAPYKGWQTYMLTYQATSNTQLPSYTTQLQLNGITSPLVSLLNSAAASTGYQVVSLAIVPVNQADQVLPSQSMASATMVPMANVPGWVATTYSYKATAVVNKVSNPTGQTISISRFFQTEAASLFQAMLFFQNDLELHPGANMTLYGLVHTNANMYSAVGAGNSLTFSSDVSYTGNTSTLSPASNYNKTYSNLNGYIEGVTQTLYNQEGSWSSFSIPTFSTSYNSQVANVQALNPLGTDEASAIDPNNPNASGTHEIIERPAPISATNPNPNPAYTDPTAFQAHRIWNSSTLRILINRNNTSQMVHVYVPNPSDATGESSIEVTPGAGTQASPTNIANQVISAITPDTGTGDIYDFRQGQNVNADTVDMSVLTPILNAYTTSTSTSSVPYNGVLYISDITNADQYGNTSSNGNGSLDAIRIEKGGILPNNGLTVASDGGVYVQGDYNTGDTYVPTTAVRAAEPPSDLGTNPTQYTVGTYTTKPASIMGDAVMILSDNWQDALSSKALGYRVATPPPFHPAIVSRAVRTPSPPHRGGAHNFPRFLENWGGTNFTYHGSMDELYASKHFTGPYGTSNVYGPPSRLWYFDNSFINSPPPGNQSSVTYSRGRWVRNSNS